MPTHKKHKISHFPELGRFSSWPAEMMDKLYLSEPKGWFGKFWRGLKLRMIYTLIFTPLLFVDLGVSAVLAIANAGMTFFVADKRQELAMKRQGKYATIFSKNWYAIAGFFLGLINPKLVAFYFTPEKPNKPGKSAGGSYYHSKKAVIKHPKNTGSLKALIKEANQHNHIVMAVGSGLSQGKQFLPKGKDRTKVVVDMSKFNTIVIDETTKTAVVGAGVKWADLQAKANTQELAVQVMQASNVFSVGGSVGGINAHGWDHRMGTLSNTILSIDIVNAQGEEETLTPDNPLFHQVTGGLGLFGIITKVKIQLVDNELLHEKGKAVSLQNYVTHFKNNVLPNDNIRMHLFRLSLDPKNLLGTGVAVDFVKEASSGTEETHNLEIEDNRGTRKNQILINFARRIKTLRKLYWTLESKRLIANNSKPMSRNAFMQPPVNAMFNPSVSEAEWLQEYFIPGENLEAFLKALGQMLMTNDVVLLNASVRFVKHNPKPLMSYSKEGDRFAVVLCFNQSLQPSEVLKAKKWLREAQHLAIEQGGSYYLPYQHVSSPEDFHQAYPDAKNIPALKAESDPKGIFTSGFYQKYISPEAQRPNYFKVIMSSEANKKEFAGFLENVLQRVNTDKFYKLLEDIMHYCDSHAEIYKELCQRLPEIMPSKFDAFRRILNSLSEIKKDLGEQAKTLLGMTKTIDGLVEIGYPGRFVGGFKKNFKVTGKITAVYEAQSVTDYIQTGAPRPYDQFAKLDYQKPNLSTLEDNSAEVITCYVGLHHFPEAELDSFLADVRRVLKPNGKFLLVDHDVTDDKTMAMAHMAHTVFNAVYGASKKEELNETRHFHPMAHWQTLLQKHDLGYHVNGPDVSMIRSGDPSRNRMVSFVNRKPALQLVQTPLVSLGEDARLSLLAANSLAPKIGGTAALSGASRLMK